MHHLLEHINQDTQRRLSKDKDPTVNKLNTRGKVNQQVNPSGPDNSQSKSEPSKSLKSDTPVCN